MPEPDNAMRRMQEEAARRAREMQARARRAQAQPQGGSRPAATQPSQTPPAPEPPPPPPAPPAAPALPGQPDSGGLLEELFKDRERTVLLALLILLGAEGGNHELMFALLFLLM